MEEEFELPEDLTELSDEDLAALAREAQDAFQEARGGTLNADTLAVLEALAAAIEAIQAEVQARETAAAEALARADALEDRVRAATAQDEGDEGDETEEEGEPEAPAPAEETAPEPAGTEPEQPAEPVAPSADEERVAVAASGSGGGRRRNAAPSMRRIRERAPEVEMPQRAWSITAAADIPGVPMGSRFDTLTPLADAMHAMARTLPIARGNGREVPVASFENPYGNVPIAEPDNAASALAAITAATSLDHLTAAGGWCTPSETVYTLFGTDCVGDLLDLPTIGVTRGGIRFPVSPSLGDIYNTTIGNGAQGPLGGVPWQWDEDDDISALDGSPTKPCIRVPCPTWEEERLGCTGICVTHGNLANAAFPEMTERFLQMVMAAHARFMNYQAIAAINTGSTDLADFTGRLGAAVPILESVDLAAYAYRQMWGMCADDVLELVVPVWVDGVFRADFSKRANVPLMDVTRAMITGWFADRGLRAQYVADWQPLTTHATAVGEDPPARVALAWPADIQMMLYAAGTWVRGTGPTINLGVVRDSTLNATNDYTAAWTEECWLLAKVGHESVRVTVPFCPDGTTVASVLAREACSPETIEPA